MRTTNSSGRAQAPTPNAYEALSRISQSFSSRSSSGSFTTTSSSSCSSSESPQHSPSPSQNYLLNSTLEMFEGSFSSDGYVQDPAYTKTCSMYSLPFILSPKPLAYYSLSHISVFIRSLFTRFTFIYLLLNYPHILLLLYFYISLLYSPSKPTTNSNLDYVSGVKLRAAAEYGRSDHSAVLHEDNMYIYGGVSVENALPPAIHVVNFGNHL